MDQLYDQIPELWAYTGYFVKFAYEETYPFEHTFAGRGLAEGFKRQVYEFRRRVRTLSAHQYTYLAPLRERLDRVRVEFLPQEDGTCVVRLRLSEVSLTGKPGRPRASRA